MVVSYCYFCLVDEGVPQYEDILPPEVSEDDQQLFSLALQVCESLVALCTIHHCIEPARSVEKGRFLTAYRMDYGNL